jgi:hypothetical protein
MAAAHVWARLSDASARRDCGLNNHYLRSIAVGFGHGIFGIWPVLLMGEWWGQRELSPKLGFLLVTVGLLWFGAGVVLSARWAARFARLSPAEKHLCPACGYDLRCTPDRCPECGAVTNRGAGAAA